MFSALPLFFKNKVFSLSGSFILIFIAIFALFLFSNTNTILIKFGFEKDDSGVEMNDPDYCDWYQKEFPIIGELCQSSDKSYLFDTETDTLRIKYVHQLQNLYFALCGEELKELEGEG